MKRLMIQKPRQCEFVEVEAPTLTPDTLLLRTLYCGILMENVGMFIGADPRVRQEGHFLYSGFPHVMPAEIVAEVAEVGSQIKGVAVGDRFVAETSLDEIHQASTDGWWTKVANSVPVEAAIAIATASVSLHCARRAQVQLGDNVAIVGQGPMGLMVTQWVRLSGAGRIIVGDFYPKRLALAKEMGATHAVNPKEENFEEVVKDLTGGEGADIVIDASNSPAGFPVALTLARYKARVVPISWHTKPITIDDITRDFCHKELDIIATRYSGPAHNLRSGLVRWTNIENFQFVVRFIEEGRFNPAPLVTHRLPLSQYAEGLRLVEKEPATTLKVLVDWRDGR